MKLTRVRGKAENKICNGKGNLEVVTFKNIIP